jgi:hypothetical protein
MNLRWQNVKKGWRSVVCWKEDDGKSVEGSKSWLVLLRLSRMVAGQSGGC